MAISVVDASALSAVIFGEPTAAEVVEQLRGSTLAAPSLLVYELGNTCWKKYQLVSPPFFRLLKMQ